MFVLNSLSNPTFFDEINCQKLKIRFFPRQIAIFSREKLSNTKNKIFSVKSQCLSWFYKITQEFSQEKLPKTATWIFRQFAMFVWILLSGPRILTRKIICISLSNQTIFTRLFRQIAMSICISLSNPRILTRKMVKFVF